MRISQILSIINGLLLSTNVVAFSFNLNITSAEPLTPKMISQDLKISR